MGPKLVLILSMSHEKDIKFRMDKNDINGDHLQHQSPVFSPKQELELSVAQRMDSLRLMNSTC